MGIAQESVRYTDHLIPNVTNTFDLGESARKWNVAYITTLNLGGTAVTSTAAELNTLAGVTAGTVTASKALVVDASKQLNELTITGTATLATLSATTVTKIATPESTPVNAVASQGTITMAGIATAEETFVISTQTFTWKAARAAAGEVTVGANAPAAVTNIVTAVTADLATVTAVDGTGDTVVVTAATKGVAGDAIVLTEASTNMTVDGAGTLGATTAGVDGTVATANEVRQDATYLYVSIAANTIADTNWRRVALGSAY